MASPFPVVRPRQALTHPTADPIGRLVLNFVMHIAIAIERFDPQGAGQDRSTLQIARHLVRRGHGVTLFTGDAPPDAAEAGIEIRNGHTLNFKHRVDPVAFARWAKPALAGEIAIGPRADGGSQRPPVDVTLSMTMLVPAAVVQPRAGVLRAAFAEHLEARSHQGGRWLGRLSALLNPRANALLRLEQQTAADAGVKQFVAISPLVATQLQHHFGLGPTRVTMIPNGADLPEISQRERHAMRRTIREAFHVPENAVVFLFATFHPKARGYHALLHALKRLVDGGRNAIVFMVGHIAYGQQSLAAKLGVRNHVRMIGPTQRMIELFSAADVTVVPTHYDAANKLVIESLMLGVPAITTAMDGASDLVAPLEAPPRGRVIADPRDVDALSTAMAALIDPAERARCAEACAGLRESLSMSKHVDELEKTLAASRHESHSP